MKLKKRLLLLSISAVLSIMCFYEEKGVVPWTRDEMRESLEQFSKLYEERPIVDNEGGMNSAHMFYVWFIVKKLQPEFIIESGIWKGQSTWLLEQAAPNAQIVAIDPNLKKRRYISPRVQYQTQDFSKTNWSFIDPKKTLCFFDDHYGYERVIQAHQFGIRYVLYEDNYPKFGGNQFNLNGNSYSVKALLKEFNEDSVFLRKIMKVYFECPPIYPNLSLKRFNYEKWKSITPDPLITKINQDFLKIFDTEAWGYTWMGFIELEGE